MRRAALGLLGLLMMTGPGWANDPKAVVSSFYQWYQKSGNHYTQQFAQQKSAFSAALYAPLQKAFASKEEVLDFDPFDNAQWPIEHYQIGSAHVDGTTAQVPVALQLGRGGKSSLTVVLQQTGGQWMIADFVYPAMPGTKSFTLSKTLHDALK